MKQVFLSVNIDMDPADSSDIPLINKHTLKFLLSDRSTQVELQETEIGYQVCVFHTAQQTAYLATARGQRRFFHKLDTAFDYLKSLGCHQSRVVSLLKVSTT